MIVARSAAAKDRRHCLAFTAHLRAKHRDNQRVGDKPLGVRGRLCRVVLAGRRGAAILNHCLHFLATNAARGVRLVDSNLEAALNFHRVRGVGSGHR